jgi:uncharacterized protein (TIGR00255 family)
MKLSVRSRPSLGAVEKRLRDLLTDRLVRGSIDVFVNFERTGEGAACAIRAESAKEAVMALRRLASELGLDDTLSARDLAQIPGVFDHSAEEPATDEEWTHIGAAAEEALRQVEEMRKAEGDKLAAILLDLANPLEDFVGQTNELAPAALLRSRERLRLRLEDLFPAGLAAADHQALEREMCMVAEKADVREELDRLTSHIAQYRAALKKGGEIGKRLEFLSQEFLREINTTASKTNDTDIVQSAVQAKLTVEKIKEQCANLV